MNKKVILFAFIMATFTCFATLWWGYPSYTYPAIVSEDWTFLLGSQTHLTNHTLPMSVMLQITKTNAQSGMQTHSANLDLWAATTPSAYEPLLGYTPQQQSANLDAWSLLSTSAKQNHSIYLDDWVGLGITGIDSGTLQVSGGILTVIGGGGGGDLSRFGSITAGHFAVWTDTTHVSDGGATSQFQTHSSNLDSWSGFTTTGYTNGLYSVFQPLNSNLSLWSAYTPINYTNNLYSLFQPALGFTPLNFVQTSNLILTLTIPLDALSTNGQVTLFGVDSSTNPVPIHARNNLTLTANGAGGYDLDSSGSGGSAAPITFTNLYGRDTNALIIDPVKAQTFSLGMLTNNILVISNTVKITNLFTHDIEVNLHQWTNGGAKLLALKNLTGNITTNGSWTQTTNANVTDKLILRFADGTYTNIVLTAITNCSTYTDTNSLLAAGGGGGGGGGLFPSDSILVDTRFNNNGTDSSGNGNTATAHGTTSYVADETGAALKAIRFDDSGTPTAYVDYASPSVLNITTTDVSFVLFVTNSPASGDFGSSPVIYGNGDFGNTGYWFQIHNADAGDSSAGYAIFAWNDLTGFQSVRTADRGITLGQQLCIVVVCQIGASPKIYINGTLATITSATMTGIVSDTTKNFTFGKYVGPASIWFGGKIQEFIAYSRVLTSGEITTGSGGTSQ
jgi:hypothetical protein